jgi:hypothetical protein
MTIQPKLRILFTTILAAFLGFIWATYTSTNQTPFNVLATVSDKHVTSPSLTRPQITSQVSPDGTRKVILKTLLNADATHTYVFSTTKDSGTTEQFITKSTLDGTKIMTIPFNTWSPDNAHFFVQEQTLDGTITHVFVFNGSGESFTNEEPYFDIPEEFIKNNIEHIFTNATGWASESLIIVNTTMPNNPKGPSYWFEVPSKAIIQLSTDF